MAQVDTISGADDTAIAQWLEARLTDALGSGGGEVFVNVPGGSTPFPILAELAKAPIDWTRITVWPGDDRIVSEDSPASNIGRIRAILEPAGAAIMPLSQDARPPHFALTWVGMGDDGHVASLFPSADPDPADLMRVRRITPDPLPPEAPFDRLTLTIPALLASDALLLVIRGDAKRAVFEDAAAGRCDTPVARLLAAAHQPVTCFT